MTVPSFITAANKPASAVPTARPQRTDVLTLPAPIGMNTMTPLAGMAAQDCIFTYNLMPFEIGLRTREGYIEWANSFVDATSAVRTIIPFVGNREDRFNDKLFCANDQGIYDITAQGTDGVSPTRVFDWPNPGATDAGWGIYTHYTNDAGAHFLMLADEANGLVEYEESTGLWSVTSGITGVDSTAVFFVMAHKQRLWLIEEDSSDAWYLPTGAKAGAATKFNFGAQFREGGNLVGLYSWTVDGGDGVDDYLVALSREGGVAVYRGDDPANASTWSLVGVWYIGRVPAGHRVASQYGGQLFFLCEHGLVNINRLLQGASLEDAVSIATEKITRVVRQELLRSIDQRGWEIRQLPAEQSYILNAPIPSKASDNLSFVRNLTTNGWGLWRGIPLFTSDVFQGRLYFSDGLSPGSVYVMDGTLDNVLLDGTAGIDVEFSLLTSYQGADGVFKRAQHCRPYFISSGLPSFSVQARFDFDLSESDAGLIIAPSSAALWDSAIWDQALWEGGVSSVDTIRGLVGWGHAIAIALKGATSNRMTLAAIDVHFERGGIL